MKVSSLLYMAGALATATEGLAVKVYKFPRSRSTQAATTELSSGDAVLNLANQLGISDKYDLDQLDDIDSLSVGQDTLFASEAPQKMVLIVQGVSDDDFLTEQIPLFSAEHSKDLEQFLANLPNEYDSESVNKLSDSINLVGASEESSFSLGEIWSHYFKLSSEHNHKLRDLWADVKSAFHSQVESSDDSIHSINDESYINELSQLKFLLEDSHVEASKVIANLKSLASVWKKTGINSKTYTNSVKILSNLIHQNLIDTSNSGLESIIIVVPTQEKEFDFASKPSTLNLHKRDSTAASSGCYTSEESCLISTSSCSNHGVCSKSGDCWSCSCTASYNSTTKSTTYWQGSDCSKKDVSVEFNLFLWFSVFMGIATILGVKLMYNVGNEELPGVLAAATAAKRSNA